MRRTLAITLALPLACACVDDVDDPAPAPMHASQLIMLEELGPPILTTLDLSSHQTHTTYAVASMG